MNNRFYVYRHLRLDTGMPFYIGISSFPYRLRDRDSRNRWWNNIVNKHGFEGEVLMDGLTLEEACAKEVEFISLYGRTIDGGILVNRSTGGDASAIGSKRTAEERAIRSKKYSGVGNPMYGKKRDDLKAYNAANKQLKSLATAIFNKQTKSKPIVGINLITKEEVEFPSQREAARSLKLDQSRIYLVLNHKAKSTGGYTFKYK